MKLFLTSAGLPKEISGDFLKLLGKDLKAVKVIFIPTAADPEEDKWFVDSAKEELRDVGLEFSEIDLKRENQSFLERKLSEVDVVYVNGGNTFYLLDWVRKTGFDKVVRDFVDRGGIYLGVSAGTMLVGPKIDLAGWKEDWDKNVTGIKDTRGLGFVNFAISPHYVESDLELLTEKSRNVDYPVVGLADSQAIVVDGSKVYAVGEGKPILLNGSKYKDFLI